MAYTTIKKPSDYFNTTLYTGNGSEDHTISGVGFQSDLTWLKSRSSAISHMWTDAVRGNNKVINSNTADAETTFSSLKSWNADGFVLSNNSNFNGNGVTFASWNWLANGAGVANTDGSINSTVSANTTSGFSIVSYTGTGTDPETIGHGLGVVPAMIIVKDRNTAGGWRVYHKSLGNDKVLALDGTIAGTTSDAWNSTTPTSSLFTVGNDTITNGNGTTHIAYCFAEKTGYSKFGSYVGNGSTDGTFVYTGFKPAFILMKRSDTGNSFDNWYIFDNKRDGFNPNNKKIAPNISDAESSDTGLFDLLSNGFKLRTTNSNNNGSGGNFIYMAFAEQPLVGDNPATAR